jgi:hypothetical protein
MSAQAPAVMDLRGAVEPALPLAVAALGRDAEARRRLNVPPRLPPIAAMVETLLRSGASAEAVVQAVADAERRRKGGAKRRRGTRLPADWQPSPVEINFALGRGMPLVRVNTEVEKFRNYWAAKVGSGATKRDWPATWRNWILNAMERGYGPASYRGQGPGTDTSPRRAPTGSDAVLAGMGRLARRIDERRMSADTGGRKVSDGRDAPRQLDFERSPTG